MSQNGSKPTANETKLELRSGVVVYASPVSPMAMSLIEAEARKKFPAPDTEPYMVEYEAAIKPGQKRLDTKNPAYIRAVDDVKEKRRRYERAAILNVGLRFVEPRPALIRRYAPLLKRLGEVADTGSLEQWLNTIIYGVIQTQEDYQAVMQIVLNQQPVTSQEVAVAMQHSFRPGIFRRLFNRLVGRRQPSGTQNKLSRRQQRPQPRNGSPA